MVQISSAELKSLLTEPGVEVDGPAPLFNGDVYFAVLQRGWIVVGRLFREGPYLRIEHGHVVRRWGTTKGLGELAMSGPLENTKLDSVTTVRVHELGVVALIHCTHPAWSETCPR